MPDSSPNIPVRTDDAVAASETPSSTATQPDNGDHERPVKWRRLKLALLVLGPLLVLLVGGYFYVTGGRYVSSENTYVQVDSVMVSPQVSGRVIAVPISENEAVAAGQVLLRLDPEPYRIKLEQAEAQVDAVRQQIEALRASYREEQARLAATEETVRFAERQFERQQQLRAQAVSSQVAYDEALHALEQARTQKAQIEQQLAQILVQLGGSIDMPAEALPQLRQAMAQRDAAALDLRYTEVHAPAAGVVSNVNLQPGDYLQAGGAAFSLMLGEQPWVEANLKETELTWVRVGQDATVTVDTYPGITWHATVGSIAPATGAEFAILPPQNATGNWVKVVQRIPVRLAVQPVPGAPPLRAGMSATVEIDTHHPRGLPEFLRTALAWTGLTTAAADEPAANGTAAGAAEEPAR